MSTGAASESTPPPKSPAPRSIPRSSPRLQELKAAKKQELLKRKEESLVQMVVEDPLQNARDGKSLIVGDTGIVYSEVMLLHENPWDPEHIETPQRLRACWQRCRDFGLVDRCKRIQSRPAKDVEVLAAHDQEHLQRLQDWTVRSSEEQKLACLTQCPTAYVNCHSLESARHAAAAAVDLTTEVVAGRLQNGMALVRPPGHHASRNEFSGFCLLNNVAIAAKHAIDNLGLRKVLIVDFDVHHGQATQRLFYNDPRVLFTSIHRYEHGRFSPYLRESNYDFVGSGDGTGHNVNVPLNKTGMTEADYLAIFHQVILPVAYEYNPDLVLVSAGYDTAFGCPEGRMSLSPAIYGHILTSLMALARGKMVVLLEGGYFLESLADGVAMSLRALLGDASCRLGPITAPSQSVIESIMNVISALRPYWSNLRVQDEYSISECDAAVDQSCHEPDLQYEGHPYLTPKPMEALRTQDIYLRHPKEDMEQLLSQYSRVRQRFAHLALQPSRALREKKVALVYDELMTRHFNTVDGSHPESPLRVRSIMDGLQDFGLLDREAVLRVPPRRADPSEVSLCHDIRHFEEMSQLPERTQNERNLVADHLDSIYLNEFSFDSALIACGSLLSVVDSVCNGDAEKGVAVIRPPGHHAEADEACGFCIFNNVAIAAQYALQNHGVKRILILDWDVHHGNGIQRMFYDNPSVLYISIHRYDNATFFPAQRDANYDYIGKGRGTGFNINIPWNGAGMGDAEYSAAFFNIILPVAYQFDPDLVLVSSGFDAANGDPLGKCKVSPEMYGHMLQHLKNLAEGKVIVALEGGYNLTCIPLCMSLCMKALLGDPLPPVKLTSQPKDSALQSIRDTIDALCSSWECLAFNKRVPDCFTDLKEQLLERSRTSVDEERQEMMEDDSGGNKYIPQEYGASFPARFVNTITNMGHVQDDNYVVDSKKLSLTPSDRTPVKALGSLTLSDSAKRVEERRRSCGGDTDYIPSEYGATFSTPCVNTISNASIIGKCRLTDATHSVQETGFDENVREASKKGQD